MKKILFIGCLIATLNSHAQIITNAGFEDWTGNCPQDVAPDGWTNWSYDYGPDQGGACAGTVTAIEGVSYMNLVWVVVGIGWLEGAEQTISGFSIGESYQLSFHGINSNGLYANSESGVIEVYLNSSLIFSTPVLDAGGSWTDYFVDFVATDTSQVIGFRVAPVNALASGSVGIDNVSISSSAQLNNFDAESNVVITPAPDGNSIAIAGCTCDQVSIIDAIGKTIPTIPDANVQIDISSLNSGVYFIQIITEEGNIIRKKFRKD